MNSLTIKNGRVIDPANDMDEVRDVFVADGKIVSAAAKDAEVIDATGKIRRTTPNPIAQNALVRHQTAKYLPVPRGHPSSV